MIPPDEAVAILCRRGYTDEALAGFSPAVLDWLASDTPYWGFHEVNVAQRSPERAEPLHETEQAALEAEGRLLSQRVGQSRATLASLANIYRIGHGIV